MSRVSRKVTCQLLEMMDEGILSPRTLAEAALNWLSEDEVVEMAHANELLPQDEDEDEEHEDEEHEDEDEDEDEA